MLGICCVRDWALLRLIVSPRTSVAADGKLTFSRVCGKSDAPLSSKELRNRQPGQKYNEVNPLFRRQLDYRRGFCGAVRPAKDGMFSGRQTLRAEEINQAAGITVGKSEGVGNHNNPFLRSCGQNSIDLNV